MILVRGDKTATELRAEASVLIRTKNAGKAVLKLFGLAHVLDGASRNEAARLAGLKPQCLAAAVKRYNAEGVDGLDDRTRSGRPPKLTPEQTKELREIVLAGPKGSDSCPEFNVRRIQDLVEAKWGVKLGAETVRVKLHSMNLVKLACRPVHHKTSLAAQEAFKAAFPQRIEKIRQAHPEAKEIEIWVQDETRVGQKGKVGRRWAEKGSSPRAVVHLGFKSAWLFGAFCPERDVGSAIVVESVSTEAMNLHLLGISKEVLPGNHAALLIDGAGFHEISKGIVVPSNISLVTLPSHSPELNPAEVAWKFLKNGPLLHRVYRSVDDVMDKCCDAWQFLTTEPGRIRSLCSFPWLMVQAATP